MSVPSLQGASPERQRPLALTLLRADRAPDGARRRAPTLVRPAADAVEPPVPIPEGHIGPVVLPGSGRTIWWTGRVAIGLRHQPQRRDEPVAQSALWVQDVLLAARERERKATARRHD